MRITFARPAATTRWRLGFCAVMATLNLSLQIPFNIGTPVEDARTEPDIGAAAALGALPVHSSRRAAAVLCVLVAGEKIGLSHYFASPCRFMAADDAKIDTVTCG
jgi:hypothetical protein